MATNTLRPAPPSPPRANVVRPVAPPPPAPKPEEPTSAAVPEEEPAEAGQAPELAEAPERAGRARKGESARRAEKPRSTWSLFSLLDRLTRMDGLFREGLPVHYLPHLLFVMGLTLLYIGNTHYGNRMNRNIQKIKQEVEDLRADYTTLKSDYMEASKQSEVARKVAAIGLVESSSPPFRIQVPAGRLDEAELELMPVLTADTLAARAARDSAAVRLADSLRGRSRRQLLAPNPANDDTPEAGAPPPGPEEDAANADGTAAPAAAAAAAEKPQTPQPAKAKKSAKKTAKKEERGRHAEPAETARAHR